MKKWTLGVYRRLSADEMKSDKDESNSVSNQKKLIDYYLSDKKDMVVYKYYADDGYTGTDFNRPGYHEMLDDIYNKRINGIIIKDLSRLGRNYIEVGDFIDEIVPKYKLRFISVNDNVDSFLNPDIMDSLEIPFKNLMNESYSRDASKKMRSSLRATKKSGNYTGKVAPYGYIKDETDCHKFNIDPVASEIVKRIFNLALKGYSKQNIAEELNADHILPPGLYLKKIIKYKYELASDKWTTRTINSILKNRTYIGELIQGKRTRISHKTHNFVKIAEDDWIVCEHHHPAIIKENIFNQVQDIMFNRNVRVNSKSEFNKYTGFLKCPECGGNLYRLTRKKKNREIIYYYCGTYLKTKNCNKHYILEKELDKMVLEIINKYIELVCDIDKKIEDTISSSRIEYDEKIKKIRLIELEKEIEKYEKLINEVISDYQNNLITKEDFDEFNTSYVFELNNLKLEKENLTKSKISTNKLDWLNKVKKIGKISEIDRNIIDEFISNIYVNEDRSVKIVFRFKEEYEDALKYLKNQNCMV